MTPDAHDENADFVDWVASRQHALLRTAYLMTGDLHRAEDLLQGALIKVADRWRRVRDGNPDAYIRTILYRDNVSWWRKRRESPVAQVRDVAVPQDADAAERTVIVRAALAGARRRRMRRSLTFAAGVSAAGVALGAVALTSPGLSGGGEGEGS